MIIIARVLISSGLNSRILIYCNIFYFVRSRNHVSDQDKKIRVNSQLEIITY